MCQTGLNFRGMKLSQMAADPRKQQKFNPVKVIAYTGMYGYIYNILISTYIDLEHIHM